MSGFDNTILDQSVTCNLYLEDEHLFLQSIALYSLLKFHSFLLLASIQSSIFESMIIVLVSHYQNINK